MQEARESAAAWDKNNNAFALRFKNFIKGRVPLFNSLTATEAQDRYEIDWPVVVNELGFTGEERFFPKITYMDVCSACNVTTRPKCWISPAGFHRVSDVPQEFESYQLYINPWQFKLFPDFTRRFNRTFTLMEGARFLLFHEVRHAWQYMNDMLWYNTESIPWGTRYVGHFAGIKGSWDHITADDYMSLPWEQDANEFALSMLSKYPASS